MGMFDDLVPRQGGGMFDDLVPQSGASTQADSQARGLPPLTMLSGPLSQITGIERNAYVRKPAPAIGQQLRESADLYGGAATGVAQSIPGIPGNVEALGRFLLSPLGVSRETALPTSSDIGNMIAGEPTSQAATAGRQAGDMFGPAIWLAALKGVSNVGRAVTPEILGGTTGAGGESVRQAYRAGRSGGSAAQTFGENMRGGAAQADDVVQMAKGAVEELRIAKNTAYRQGIGATIKGDPAVLDFQPIEDAINKVSGVQNFKGQSLSAAADQVRNRITEEVAKWKALDPAEFHTPEGLDALKQKIGNLAYEGELAAAAKPNSPGAIVVNNVYKAVRDQIVKQAPGYGKVMKDYMEAASEIREIEKSLSLGRNSTTDTALRKLQSILRNNANTNYGARVNAGETLAATNSAEDLMPALAGQSLNSAMPRGIQGPLAGIGAATLPFTAPQALPGLALTSPRLVGEGSFAAGNIARILADTLKKSRTVPGGGASVPRVNSISPKMLAMMSPSVLAALLAPSANTTP